MQTVDALRRSGYTGHRTCESSFHTKGGFAFSSKKPKANASVIDTDRRLSLLRMFAKRMKITGLPRDGERGTHMDNNNLVIVTDFDGTLMKEDVGDTVMKELGILEREETIEVTRKFIGKEIGTMKWIEVAYSFLEGRQAEVDALLESVSPRQGAPRFLDFCKERQIPVVILSDGMAYYIEKLTQKFGIEADKIISNPIRYLSDGEYSLGFQNPNPSCRWCGCCKADAVRRLKEEGSKVIYIGDGVSDLYGSSFADWIFARSTLANFLTESGEQFYRFETFDDIMDVFAGDYDAFSAGTAARMRSKENTFCRFA